MYKIRKILVHNRATYLRFRTSIDVTFSFPSTPAFDLILVVICGGYYVTGAFPKMVVPAV